MVPVHCQRKEKPTCFMKIGNMCIPLISQWLTAEFSLGQVPHPGVMSSGGLCTLLLQFCLDWGVVECEE